MRGLPPPPPAGTPMLPADTFADDVVVIVGAGQLLSQAAAVEFARAGARVALVFDAGETPAVPPELGAANTASQALAVELLDEAAVAGAFDAIEASLGQATVLLCQPPLPRTAPAERISLAHWRAVNQSISDTVFLWSCEFARRCIDKRHHGSILNVIETMAWQGGPGTAHAAAAEAAVLNLSRTLATEWGPDDIRVNAIAVAAFAGDDTPAARQAAREGRDLAGTLPALRLGQPQEFGWAATLLCSPYAAYTSGAVLTVDGGSQLRRGISGPRFRPVREWAEE